MTFLDLKPKLTALAPASIAVLAIIVGVFVPFVGLPSAMVAVVAIPAAGIENRRLLYVTVVGVALSILTNLTLVMLALPTARRLVEAA